MEYAYIGDVTTREFGEITRAFPNIVGIGSVVDPDNGNDLICIGVDNTLPNDVIGMYQLIIALWGDDAARKRAWDAIDDTSKVNANEAALQLQINILKHQLMLVEAEANQYKADAIKWAKAYDDMRYEYNKARAYFTSID